MTMTKSQYLIRLIIGIPVTILVCSVFFVEGHPVVGTILLLMMVCIAYFAWRIGREGAGWGG
jgi:hypothetical protein